MQGCGNDYVYVNGFVEKIDTEAKPDIVRRLSDRHFGIGGDGVIFINPSEIADFEMEMFNADGSRSQMCGNGIRCVAKYVYDYGLTDKTSLTIESFGAIKYIDLTVENGKVSLVKVNMGAPILTAKDVPVLSENEQVIDEEIEVEGKNYRMTCVSMGNPHCVTFVDDVDSLELEKIGPSFENHEAFPQRINTEFVKVIDEKTLEVTLTSPTPYFLELTAFKTMYPIHKATAAENPNWFTEADTYVGNGAFVLSQWQHAGSLTLEKNPEYWDADNVKLSKVNIEMVESETTQMTKFESGEIDFLGTNYGSISLDAIERLKSEDKLNIVDYSGIYWYKFNTTDDVMKNENIRKALTLAIDREGLIANITKGEQEPALGIVPNGVEGFGDDEGFFKDADYEGAKAALDAGLTPCAKCSD